MNTQYGVSTLDSAYSANNSQPSGNSNVPGGGNTNWSNVYSNVAKSVPIDKTVIIILVLIVGIIILAHVGLKVSGDIVADV